MGWCGADHLVGVAYWFWCVITVALIRITVCCSQLSSVFCVAYLLFVNCSCSCSGWWCDRVLAALKVWGGWFYGGFSITGLSGVGKVRCPCGMNVVCWTFRLCF